MKKLPFLLILILTGSLLWGEQKNTEVFAPFVSRLKAKAGENSITLTWRGSQDVLSHRLIFRHTEEISANNFAEAQRIARLAPETDVYIDYPPDTEKYFYAVLLEDEKKKPYKLFISFRNKTTSGAAISSLAPEKDLAAEVSGIGTRVGENSILISFQISKPNRELLLFRSEAPILNPEDLPPYPVRLKANTTSYQDYPIQGIDYYYAVLDAGLFGIGRAELTAGVNTTLNPVQLPMGPGLVGLPETAPLHPTTLPKLLITAGVERGNELSPSSPFLIPKRAEGLEEATESAIQQVLSVSPPLQDPDMQIQILPVDRVVSSGGEAYTLQYILHEHLLKNNFREAEDLLLNYLSIWRSEQIEARAHLYLAQTYYFQQRFKEAFLEFLLAEDEYFQEIQPWLKACFRNLPDQD